MHITRCALQVPGDPSPAAVRADLLTGRPRTGAEPLSPPRPAKVPMGSWRRMSRLDRMAMQAAIPLVEDRPDLDRIAILWATSLGEVEPTTRFLDRAYQEGPEMASPLAFQNSVYNAPASHMGMSLGMHGPTETICAGAGSGAAALARARDLLATHQAPAVLVMGGDEISRKLSRALELADYAPPGEAVAALLLEPEGPGPRLSVRHGIHLPDEGPLFARQLRFPEEGPIAALPSAIAPEAVFGLTSGLGLVSVVAATVGGGTIIDQDGPSAWTLRVEPG